jgi:uncharacterized SAM-binding protein YcdF (DUF218 family)
MTVAIVLGKEYRRFNGKPVLSMEAKMTAIAAGEMYQCGVVRLLIFTGGKTAGPEYPSEAEAMARYCMRLYPEIPREGIIIEDVAFDTIANARLVKKIIQNNEIGSMPVLISRKYHMERAQGIFLREGMKTDPIPAEDILFFRSLRHRKLADAYMHSLYYRAVRVKEYLLRLQLAVDPEARIQRFVTRRMRFAK